MMLCSRPFDEIEIDVDGNCYCCCRWWNNSYCLGNILQDNIEDIWNGQAAQEIRRSIIEGDYKYCNISECIPVQAPEVSYTQVTQYPHEISLCYDYTCNAKCVFCNDEVKRMPKDDSDKWDNILNTKFVTLFSNAKFVRLSMVGELFCSEHSKNVIQTIISKYPNIKFKIVTNGVLCSKENIEKYNLTDRLDFVKFSLPSISEKTYKKMVRNGNLKNVLKNLEYVSSLKKQNKINDFRLNFVITSLNYKEFPKYVKYAYELGANVDCLLCDKKDGNTEFLRNFDKYNVASSKHPQYNNFIDVINSIDYKKYKNVFINDDILHLKKVSFIQYIKNVVSWRKHYCCLKKK